MKSSKNKILLELENPIAFYPQIARKLGGINEAVFVQQIYYWQSRAKRVDGFIYKTQKEWEEETTLTRDQQDRVRKKLIKAKLLEIKKTKANGSPTLHYKLNLVLLQKILQNPQIQLRETRKSNSVKPTKPLTENITEITLPNGNVADAKNKNNPTSEDRGFGGESPKEDNQSVGAPALANPLTKEVQEIMDLFYEINPTLNFANLTQRKAAEWMLKKWGIEKVKAMAQKVISCQGKAYAPVATTPYDMKEKLAKFAIYFKNNSKPKPQMYEG